MAHGCRWRISERLPVRKGIHVGAHWLRDWKRYSLPSQTHTLWSTTVGSRVVQCHVRCEHEQGLFVLRGGDIRLVLYVDDLLIIAENDKALTEFKQALSAKWDMTDLGIATQFCGMEL